MTECARCSACCRVIPLSTSTMSPEYRKYLLNRGLKEEQGFILILHDCQHLFKDKEIQVQPPGVCAPVSVPVYACDIHDSPDRAFICRKFTGQKQIGRWKMYIPPGCAFNNKS